MIFFTDEEWQARQSKLESYQKSSADKPVESMPSLDRETAKKMVSRVKLPWSYVIGREIPARVDVIDAEGELVCHMHAIEPANIRSKDFIQSAEFMVHLTQIIKALEEGK